jgi:hypothetical protein
MASLFKSLKISGTLSGHELAAVPLFDLAIYDAQVAFIETAAIASATNAIYHGRRLRSPLAIRNFMPRVSQAILKCNRLEGDLGLSAKTIKELQAFFTRDEAWSLAEQFCQHSESFFDKPLLGQNYAPLAMAWRNRTLRARKLMRDLLPQISRCLPEWNYQSALAVKAVLIEASNGGTPCIDRGGDIVLPVLNLRNPLPRIQKSLPCVIEYRGTTSDATIKDISAGGIGLSHNTRLEPDFSIIIDIVDHQRLLSGLVVWSKGNMAGVKFNTNLAESDPLLVG